jgi:fatty-acyl-CoA synthase
MAALELRPGATFDPTDFDEFLSEQPDLGTKWSPRYLRVMSALPMTETQKILKRVLRRERWDVSDPVWWRPSKAAPLEAMTDASRGELLGRFEARGRVAALEAG